MISRLDLPPTDLSSLQPAASRDSADARRVAMEFEALLLKNFTAALNPSSDDEDADLFHSDATDMYRQMFSEQMATAVAKNGGVGLADVVMQQLGNKKDDLKAAAPGIARALEAARQVRSEAVKTENAASSHAVSHAVSSHAAASKSAPHTASSSAPVKAVMLQMPIAGRITSGFGTRRDPINGHHRAHGGVDIAAPRGTPIEAAASGTVVFSGRQGGYGKTVVIEHADGRRTRYAHADKLIVKRGDTVDAGQMIATVGSTGRATGPHLHFEVTENGDRVDPLQVTVNDFTLASR